MVLKKNLFILLCVLTTMCAFLMENYLKFKKKTHKTALASDRSVHS